MHIEIKASLLRHYFAEKHGIEITRQAIMKWMYYVITTSIIITTSMKWMYYVITTLCYVMAKVTDIDPIAESYRPHAF